MALNMLRVLVILLVSVSVWAMPEPMERRDPMVSMAGEMVKSMAGKAAKNIAEEMVDQATNMFDMAQSAGKSIKEMWQSGAQDEENEKNELNEDEHKHKYGYKYRRSQDPLVDALLQKRIENTIKDIDQVLALKRNARAEDSSPMSVVTSVLTTLIGLLKNIPQLAPLIEVLRPILGAAGIHI